MDLPTLIPTILCGGAGSRLWPVSRSLHPKPFLQLQDGESLLQKAFIRAAALPNVDEILTVTNRDLLFKTRDEYQTLISDDKQPILQKYILEPVGRNTASAIAIAAVETARAHGENAHMLVLPADQLIEEHGAFQQAVAQAIELANTGKLVTFGIRPQSPETGYGYIEAAGSEVIRFVEKPDFEKALSYIQSGNFCWNSGMFCFSVGAMLREFDRLCPDLLANARRCLEEGRLAQGDGYLQLELGSAFAQMPDLSIDYAVMEKTDNAAVVACDIGWSDVGCWKALGELTAADDNNNRVEGEALLHNTTNCTIKSSGRFIGTVGIDNLVIVDTPDALLVADKQHTQDVKSIYATLKGMDHELHKEHRTVCRPWGSYTVLQESDNYKIKRIEVKPGASLSLQSHRHRAEHWVVVKGQAKALNDDRELVLNLNESTYIPAGCKHRLSNETNEAVTIIEVQSGSYLGEDDIVRFDDDYGRPISHSLECKCFSK